MLGGTLNPSERLFQKMDYPKKVLLLMGICLSVDFTHELCGTPRYPPDLSGGPGPTPALPCSYPWQVILTHVNALRCGGAVVDAAWIVTAAGCVNQYQSRPGDWTVTVGVDESSQIIKKITAIEVHPKYSLFYGDYDLALVRVDELEFSEAVSPVCLPSGVLESSSVCVLTGWCVVNGQRASSLQQRLVPVQDSRVCNESRPPCGTERMCPLSSISGSGRCPFDTGDPLVCKSGDVFVLGGVQGGRADCGDPACVYSRVEAMVGWIKGVIRQYECPTDLELPAPPAALLSPPYAPNLACSWVLWLGEKRRAEVTVSKVHTPSMDCRSAFFSIEQQTGNQTLLLDRFCGKLKYPYKVYSLLSDDKSFLRFSYKTHTDDPSPDYGFSLTYKYVTD